MHPSADNIQKALKQITNFLEPLLSFANCHMVNYITHDHWNTFLNKKIKTDLQNLSVEQLKQLPTATLGIENGEVNEWCSEGGNITSFMAAIRKHHLSAINMLTPLEQILEHHGLQDIPTIEMKGIMSEKKMHEVDIMSNVVARIAKGKNSDYIVDAGSGKGYLSTSLALQYNIKVLAIDSSCSNTSSAIQRNTRLQKYWESLKRSEKDKSEGKPERRGKNWKKKQARKEKEDQLLKNDQCDVYTSKEVKNQNESNANQTFAKDDIAVESNLINGKYIGITHFLLQDTNLEELVNQSFNDQYYKLETNYPSEIEMSSKICDRKYSDWKQGNKINEKPLDRIENNSTLGIVGLHTCGNLSSISLKLLIANPSVHFLCNVGCCYHLIKEEFCTDSYTKTTPKDMQDGVFVLKDDRYENCSFDPMHPKENPNTTVGFPLSSYLKNRKFSLGRNARMLAAQATDRLTSPETVLNRSLYWRALLQELLCKKYGAVSESFQVGRIAAKSSNFNEYVQKSLNKLDLKIEITEDEINSYMEKYALHENRLQRFFLLRSSLAPIIEGLILLDRMAFLSEQEQVSSAHLVQLFDPVASPRCHAIIAFQT